MDQDLIVRTQYDEKDLMSVHEIFFIDEDGDEHIHYEATARCIGITTCADQGTDLWEWITYAVKIKLQSSGIPYSSVMCEEDPGLTLALEDEQ